MSQGPLARRGEENAEEGTGCMITLHYQHILRRKKWQCNHSQIHMMPVPWAWAFQLRQSLAAGDTRRDEAGGWTEGCSPSAILRLWSPTPALHTRSQWLPLRLKLIYMGFVILNTGSLKHIDCWFNIFSLNKDLTLHLKPSPLEGYTNQINTLWKNIYTDTLKSLRNFLYI